MPRRNIVICLQLVLVVLIMPRVLFDKSEIPLYLVTIAMGLLFVGIFYFLTSDGKIDRYLLSIGSGIFKKNIFPALQVLLLFLVVYFQKFYIDPVGDGYITLLVVSAVLVVAFVEEYAFRFYIQRNLVRLGLPLYKVILISSGLFAFAHGISFSLLQTDIYGAVNQVIFDYCLGILLASLFFITESLLFVTIFHFLITLPAAIGKLRIEELAWEQSLTGQPIAYSVSGCLWFIVFISPLIIVSLYYLWKVTRGNKFGGNHLLNS